MTHRGGKAVLAVVILLMASLALAQTKTVEEIVARVNGDIILKSELEDARTSLRADLSQQSLQGVQLEQAFAEQSKYLLRQLIDNALLMQQAKELGLNADLEVVKTMERLRQENKYASLDVLEQEIVKAGVSVDEFKQRIRTQYLSGQVLGREVYPKIIVTTEEIRKYYDANPKNFDRPEGVRVSEIAVYTEGKSPAEIEQQKKKAEEAHAALKKGDDFPQVAQRYSEAPSARDGGDLGFFVEGDLAKPLEDAVAKLDKGQVSDILPMPYGFVILKVDDKHSGGILPFELAQKEITETLWQQRVQPKVREYLTKLRCDGFIDVRPGYVDEGACKADKVSER
jgi:peptidyl-prolyl cis-trans isomerase SurA